MYASSARPLREACSFSGPYEDQLFRLASKLLYV